MTFCLQCCLQDISIDVYGRHKAEEYAEHSKQESGAHETPTADDLAQEQEEDELDKLLA